MRGRQILRRLQVLLLIAPLLGNWFTAPLGPGSMASLLLPSRPARLTALVKVMDRIYPTKRAAAWDNVGLLVDTAKSEFPERMTVFLTNDLTEKVAAEALREGADVIVAYHPTPFHKFNKLDREDVTARILLALAAKGIAVYAPHTACDAAAGGVNDWLISAFDCAEVRAAKPCEPPAEPEEGPVGAGRVAELKASITLQRAVEQVKQHLGLGHLRVSPALRAEGAVDSTRWSPESASAIMGAVTVRSVAVCAGSGGGVLAGVKADLYLTGEMSHHEVLAANHAGVSVILAEHSNTERGFLPTMKKQIEDGMVLERVAADAFDVKITQLDADPLLVV